MSTLRFSGLKAGDSMKQDAGPGSRGLSKGTNSEMGPALPLWSDVACSRGTASSPWDGVLIFQRKIGAERRRLAVPWGALRIIEMIDSKIDIPIRSVQRRSEHTHDRNNTRDNYQNTGDSVHPSNSDCVQLLSEKYNAGTKKQKP